MQNPKHIAITGASSGIGAALAVLYAAPGITLALHGRDRNRLEPIAEHARSKGATVTTRYGEVTDRADLTAWLQQQTATQPLDLLIANAGLSAGTGGGGESAAQAERIFAVNVSGVVNSVHAALPIFMAQGRGQIALMASLAGFRGLPGCPAYSASKAAVRLYGEALRGELLDKNISVSVICPGYVATPMTAENHFPMPFIMTAERAAAIIKQALNRNRARIAFPWPLYAAVWALAALPPGATDWFMARLPKKP
jgi:short-subunit dehydrogenase